MRTSEESAPALLDQGTARRAYRDGQKRARRKVNDELLTEVAALYRDTINDGPWRAIAERFGVSETTAGRYVMLARKAGLLPKTAPGRKNA
jgi:transposase